MTALQTEFEFVLPKGFIDNTGTMHRKGIMRLATAMDEITPLRDPRVRTNEAYLSILLLSRVITHLGSLNESEINSGVIERFFSADLAYLQTLYNQINSSTSSASDTLCPSCGRLIHSQSDESSLQEEVRQLVGVGG